MSIDKLKNHKKVLVLMSGGVDSSVVALLLKKQGCAVSGVYLRNWEKSVGDILECDHNRDSRDAREVAKKINIPFAVWNFSKEYQQAVIDYFVAGYKQGLTPNPDIRCNQFIKFGVVLDKAVNLGFDYLATGHYAAVNYQNSVCHLFTAKDRNKDQTYFLSTLKQNQLRKIIFPLADLTKSQVRRIAKDNHLATWSKKDSTGICFVGEVKLKDFLGQFIPEKKGKIISESGQILGQHSGAWFFTIGQRHGLGLGGGEPFYVKAIDAKKNQVVVATQKRQRRAIYQTKIKLSNLRWLASQPELPLSCLVRIRHQGKLAKAKLFKSGLIKFATPQRALAGGQQAVFYSLKKFNSRREVIGSGVING